MTNYIEKEQRKLAKLDDATVQAFWNRVHVINDRDSCWKWFGPRANGYGIFCHKGKNHRASRWVWQMCKSDLPAGLVVMHLCDNPSCCRPSHLLLGTTADNRRDCVRKRRHTQGTGVWNAVLDPAKVTAIRSLYSSREYTQAEIAAIFKVTQPAISYIVTGTNWKQVTPA